MEEVSGHATVALLDAAAREGIAPERLLRGVPLTVEHLREPRRRVDWADFAAICDNLGALCSDEQLERMGAGLLVGTYGFMRHIAGILLDARDFYELGTRWTVSTDFLNLHPTLTAQPDGRLLYVANLSAGYRPCRGFLRIIRGGLAAAPTLLGLPPAQVEEVPDDPRGAFAITLPPPMPLGQRVRRGARALLRLRALIEELARQRADVQRSYQELVRARQDIRQVIENIPDVVVVVRGMTAVWANRPAAACLGYDRPEDLVGVSVLDHVHPDDRARLIERSRRPTGSGPNGGRDEYRLVRRDGELVHVEVAPSSELQFDGQPARLVVARDVTERRRMQEQILLSERLASLGTLAAGVAHEINNPLAYIHLNLEIAAREVAAAGDRKLAKAEGAIADALEGVARVRSIVGDLKTFSRARGDAGGSVDVHEILDSAAALAASEIRSHARVVKEYGEVPSAQASRQRLGQVFLNLLLNAAEAIPEGQPDRNEIRICTSTDAAGRVVVEVSDTGAGIPEAILGRIFDPFFTTKPAGRGTGLGLAICHHLVTTLGGEITARSVEGRGSTFRVALPAAEARPGQRPRRRSDAPPPPSGGRARVLVIDDEPALVRSLEATLGGTCEVSASSSSQAALEILRLGADFDVILCDLMMSGISGMALRAALASVRPELCSRLVFITGGAYTAEARAFLSEAPNRCLHKPFSAREVLEVVREVIAAGRGEAITGPED